MMKQFHPASFFYGLGSGLAVLFLAFGIARAVRPSVRPGFQSGQFRQMQDPAAMAERLGMTEEEVRAELDTGKTMREIMQEHGMQGGFRPGITGSGSRAGSGSSLGASSIPSSSSSASSI